MQSTGSKIVGNGSPQKTIYVKKTKTSLTSPKKAVTFENQQQVDISEKYQG